MNDQVHELKSDLAIEALRASGLLRLKVRGNSMLPSLWPGDLVTIAAQAFQNIQAGDIVLYWRESRFFMHRVRHKREILITRGDCMSCDDPEVAASEVLGKVISLRRYGMELPAPRLTWLRCMQASLLRNSDFLQRVALWKHAARLRRWTNIPTVCPEYSIQ
jgi:hypothetical protein